MSEQRYPEAVRALETDPALAPYIEEHGPVTLEPAADPFERLVVSVLRQQVSMDAAAAIRERLFEAVEVTPAGIQAANEAVLQEAGLSTAKVEYVNELARVWDEEGYSRSTFADLDDETVQAELTSIRGIGPWTAKMFLLFGLARPDVFPVEDLGVRRGMEIVCGQDMTRAAMRDRASEWAPYRSYASLYLWRAYEG